MSTARIIGFGAVAIDELLRVDRPLSAGKGRVVEEWQDHGGNVATALVAASALGEPAGYVGWLSDDPRDGAVTASLSSRGVDVGCATRATNARPIRSTIIVDDAGERFIAFRDDTRLGAPLGFSPRDHRTARFLLIDGYAAHTPVVVVEAIAAGLEVIADIEWSIGAGTDELLAACQHLVLPWEFAASCTGETAVHAMIEALWSNDRHAVVITRGASGAWVRQRSEEGVWHQPGFDVDVIDTTGCGDWFHGAYAAALCHGQDPRGSVRFAAAAAALSAGSLGGRSDAVTPEAVQRLMGSARAPHPVPVTC